MKNCDTILPINHKAESNTEFYAFMNLILLKQLFTQAKEIEKIPLLFDELMLFKPITNILQRQVNATSIHQKIELTKVLVLSFLEEKRDSIGRKKKET